MANKVSRRQFLHTASIGALGAAMAGGSGGLLRFLRQLHHCFCQRYLHPRQLFCHLQGHQLRRYRHHDPLTLRASRM